MAHTKASKATKGSRSAQPKHLGIKKYEGEIVLPGTILVRQRGSHFHPGEGTKLGNDYTLFALVKGKVKYYERNNKSFVSVVNSS
jgi:large subunit ribosomal protein L27